MKSLNKKNSLKDHSLSTQASATFFHKPTKNNLQKYNELKYLLVLRHNIRQRLKNLKQHQKTSAEISQLERLKTETERNLEKFTQQTNSVLTKNYHTSLVKPLVAMASTAWFFHGLNADLQSIGIHSSSDILSNISYAKDMCSKKLSDIEDDIHGFFKQDIKESIDDAVSDTPLKPILDGISSGSSVKDLLQDVSRDPSVKQVLASLENYRLENLFSHLPKDLQNINISTISNLTSTGLGQMLPGVNLQELQSKLLGYLDTKNISDLIRSLEDLEKLQLTINENSLKFPGQSNLSIEELLQPDFNFNNSSKDEDNEDE